MLILHQLIRKFKDDFTHSRKGEERGAWFTDTLLAVIIPFTSSKTSNLLRCLYAVLGFTRITKFIRRSGYSKKPLPLLSRTTEP